MRACLLQPDVVHRPLLVWRSWVVGCASGTASGVEPAAVGCTTATDGELAFLLDGWVFFFFQSLPMKRPGWKMVMSKTAGIIMPPSRIMNGT